MVWAPTEYPQLKKGLSLYLHVPFCQTKCPYCDFNTYQGIDSLIGQYMEALLLEIQLWGRAMGRPRVETLFFGGGTPSYIPLEYIERVLATTTDSFEVVPGAETTVEANPGDVAAAGMTKLLKMGVDRLSIGVQSLDGGLLALLGRRHSADEAVGSYTLARQAGFERVSLDLMYGLPSQTLGQWENTLKRVLDLEPPHLSLYCLTLEQGTPLDIWVRTGKLPGPDPDLAADMYIMAQEALADAGYHHYEISNWALPAEESLHNMAYWLNRPYLGVGAGAHSHLQGHRFWNVAPPRLYIQKVQGWASDFGGRLETLDEDSLGRAGAVAEVEVIGPELAMAETMFLGLRLLDGLRMDEFTRRFGRDPIDIYGSQIRELEEEGLLEQLDGVLRLTKRGCLLSNQVFMRFLE